MLPRGFGTAFSYGATLVATGAGAAWSVYAGTTVLLRLHVLNIDQVHLIAYSECARSGISAVE